MVIKNVSKLYKDKWAVKDFNCNLEYGVYGFVGPNGAGKTTLMRMLADILKPTSGMISVDGANIHKMSEKYRNILGYLPQNIGLYSDFTTHQFLMYFAALKGLSKKQAHTKIEELLELVDLKENVKRKIGTFSGGMRRRLGIALTLLNDPKILILDEPTAGLDPEERVRFRNLISRFSGDRIVLLSTHIITDIEYIAKEIIMINNGLLIRKDKPKEILSSLNGKVWECTTLECNIPKLDTMYKIGNILRVEEGVSLRIISDVKPYIDAELQLPTLEDAYLYFFGKEVHK